jgi:hypothetical protein
MLGENTNPNTNNQVCEGECPPAGESLAQRKRPREANGKFTVTTAEDQKRSRQAASAKRTQKYSRVSMPKSLRSNLYLALGDCGTDEGGNGNPGTEKGWTEVLIFLLSKVRLDDGTHFKVDPANDYEIIKVRGSRIFFLHVRA